MTIEQGNEINALYKKYRFQIDSLKIDAQANKLLIDSLQLTYDSLGKKLHDAMQYKWKYEANREIFFKEETSHRFDQKLHEVSKLILVGIILLQFNSISNLQDQINHK